MLDRTRRLVEAVQPPISNNFPVMVYCRITIVYQLYDGSDSSWGAPTDATNFCWGCLDTLVGKIRVLPPGMDRLRLMAALEACAIKISDHDTIPKIMTLFDHLKPLDKLEFTSDEMILLGHVLVGVSGRLAHDDAMRVYHHLSK